MNQKFFDFSQKYPHLKIGIITGDIKTNPDADVLIMTTEILMNKLYQIQSKSNIPVHSSVSFEMDMEQELGVVIFDEIHMIGKKEGFAMEQIIKIYPETPFLGLSATISNLEEMRVWLSKISKTEVKSIICDKRFFNLQRFNYNPSNNTLESLNPLSMISVEEFANGKVLDKNLQPTPPDTWNLYKKIKENYSDMKDIDHKKYFGERERVHLTKATNYFYDLVKFMVDNFDETKVNKIIDSFKSIGISEKEKSIGIIEDEVNIVKLAFLLKEQDKTPAIIFQKNTNATLRIVRRFAKDVEKLENEKYPRLINERIKNLKKAEKQYKQMENTMEKLTKSLENAKKKNESFRKDTRDFIRIAKHKEKEGIDDTDENVDVEALQKPTDDFIFTKYQNFSSGTVEEWVKELKQYFPSTGQEYHFIIKLLWRGVGVYAKGLPDPYLRIVQKLSSEKLLAIVFSDMSLAFGVSMPFRTVVVNRDNMTDDDLDPLIYHQMAGRAGRRGLDTEGNVIFSGYKWKRIEELSVCPIPKIEGINTINMVPLS